MENVNFQPSGEDIERALMDLGPLLGVTIKEEVNEDLPDANTQPSAQLNVGSLPDVAAGAAGASSNPEGGDAAEGHDKGSADSLASPTTGRVPLSSARCVMCQGTLAHTDGTPKLMECLHSACEPCIKAKIEEKQAASSNFLGTDRITITCPVCRLQCQPSNMIDQRFVIEKLAVEQVGANGISGEQQCNSCEDTEPATSYCVDCAEFICENCVHAHQRLKITKDHTIKTKEEAVAELQAAQNNTHNAHDMYCTEHPQERLSLFCETCDRLTCRDCQLQHHRDHKYQFSTEMAAHARANISSLLSEVSYKRVLLGSAMKVIRDRQQLIADKKKALVHEITQTVVRLTNAINTRGKQLVLRLNEVCDAKQRTLSEKKDALEQLAAITDHCVEFVNAALEQGSDTALLYAKHSVCAHLLRIKSRRADIPNPEIPVRINLALDKLPELLRVLSSMGAIVVDGKVDGGSSGGSGSGTGGGAQGPYHQVAVPTSHPAPPAPPPHPAANPNNSAVVALQHVAMHQQSYGGGTLGGSGAAAAYGAVTQLRGRAHTPHTPLRHPHVTSTTHPHHLHGMNEMNLRGLLNAASQRGASPVRQQHPQHPQHPQHSAQVAMHHAYQQMMGAYATNAYAVAAGVGNACGGRRSGGPRTPSPAPAAAPAPAPAHPSHPAQFALHHQPPAKWHIPQHSLTNGGFESNMMSTSQNSGGSDYKITLCRPAGSGAVSRTQCAPPTVTSTNPKTPSPSLNGGVSSELDKVCAESVQDLMATIAKLDSNGVQVVAEHAGDLRDLPAEPAPSPAPHVHSSTDPDLLAGKSSGSRMSVSGGVGVGAGAGSASGGGAGTGGASDPNEDWCAVCMDGGELMCCDKCPKVFHQYCHIPTIEKLPDETETWQCLLCVNFSSIPANPAEEETPPEGGLSLRHQKLVERLTLELYCQYELSLPFREPVPSENLHYHSKISRPMCLDMIRIKLQPRSPMRYMHVSQFVADCRLLFRNAYRYNPPDTQVYKDAKRLEEFFDAQLVKWLPEYAYWSGEGDPPAKRARLD